MKKIIVRLYNCLLKSRLKNEDLKRREFIFNIILLGSIILSLVCVALTTFETIKFGSGYRGISPLIVLAVFLIFLILYFLSRKGFFIISAYVLIMAYFLPVTYITYKWGIDLTQGILTYVLIIIVSGILISARFSAIITLLISSTIITLGYLQNNGITRPNLYWKKEIQGAEDAIAIAATFGIIVIISWLSNREIEKSLQRARNSEAALQKERDLLEIKVEQRTKELKKVQIEKMKHLYRFAEFGRLSSGLFHDLINPLTALSLNLEQAQDIERKELSDTKTYLAQAISVTKRMENFILAVRKQIAKEGSKTFFSLNEEIMQTIQILSYKAKKANVEIVLLLPANDMQTYGNSIKFSQVATNLICNAVSAYEGTGQCVKKKEVLVNLSVEDNIIRFIVQDYGKGISIKHLNKIFEPFFTTRHAGKDLGLGLSIVKSIIEKDFNGGIKVESKEGEKTRFIVEFPQTQNQHHNKHWQTS